MEFRPITKFTIPFAICCLVSVVLGCTRAKAPLGTEENPIKFYFVPSVDAKLLEATGRKVKERLEKVTPYKYRFAVPTSYVSVVEAFGTNRADVAALNTYGYVMAHERFGAEARILFVRNKLETYQAAIVAKADSPIQSVKDLDGKKFAYVDPSSTSGYLLPRKLFKDNNVSPKETVFAQKHDNVVTMVRQGQVDAGAIFYSPPRDGKIEDARRLVKTQFPDIEKEVRIVMLTEPIPNDPIVFRRGLPEEIKETIVRELINYMNTEEGRSVFYDIYGITGMLKTTDARYDSVREMFRVLGKGK